MVVLLIAGLNAAAVLPASAYMRVTRGAASTTAEEYPDSASPSELRHEAITHRRTSPFSPATGVRVCRLRWLSHPLLNGSGSLSRRWNSGAWDAAGAGRCPAAGKALRIWIQSQTC